MPNVLGLSRMRGVTEVGKFKAVRGHWQFQGFENIKAGERLDIYTKILPSTGTLFVRTPMVEESICSRQT